MKNVKFLFLVIIVTTLHLTLTAQHNIKIKIDGLKDTTLILGHHFNQKMYVNDTININSKGEGFFAGKDLLPQGLYVMFLPDKTYFDVLIGSDQDFSVNTKSTDLLNQLIINGSVESKNFCEYQKFLSNKQATAQKTQEKLELIKSNPDSTKILQDQLQNLSTEVTTYWNKAIANNPGTFFELFLKAIKEVEVPDFKAENGVANPDSVIQWKRYYYYKEHYFDNMNLTDGRLLRTPFFANKVDQFFTKTLFQIPDTLTHESIKLIEKVKSNKEMFQFILQYLFNMANESKLMGMDEMTLELGEKYYLSGEAPWADTTFIKSLSERVEKIKPNLIGKIAPDIKLQSNTGEFYRLSELNATYTILVFWEPSCGHCQKELPKLHDEVFKNYKDKGIKVFAVYTQLEKELWEKFITEHNLTDFINVYDPYNQSRFRDLYDIYSTPVIYILDRNKKIVAKRIGVENIAGFLDFEIKNGRL